MSDPLATYLRLSPEFGGTRFGPFEGSEIIIGSERGRCDIAPPAELGVLPVHVKLLRQPDFSMILAPVERTATVFLWKQNARKPVQVTTPTAVRAGDSFALVTETGLRFLIELDKLPPQVIAEREAKRKKGMMPTAADMGREAKRQAWTTILVTGPGQMVQRAFVFVKSGAAFQPRYIFLAVTLIAGYAWGGTKSCSVKKLKAKVQTSTEQLTSCQNSMSFAGSKGGKNPTFSDLVTNISENAMMVSMLSEDTNLLQAVKQKTRLLMAQQGGYDWLLKGTDLRASEFKQWREKIVAEKKLDPNLVPLLPFIGLDTTLGEWAQIEDSETRTVCGRGPMRLSWRQAIHLGLNTQMDAFVVGNLEAVQGDKARRDELLRATAATVGQMPPSTEDNKTLLTPFGTGNPIGCLVIEGDDDRRENDRLLKMLVEQIGGDVSGLPPNQTTHSISARVSKLYLADLILEDFSKSASLNLSQGPVGALLAAGDSKRKWALERTAETIARSLVIPCEARLRLTEEEAAKAEKTIGKLPSPYPCVYLNYMLSHETPK